VSNGKLIAIKGTVQAVFPPVEEPAPLMAGKASGAAGGSYGGTANVNPVTDARPGSNTESSSKPEPASDPKSVGVQGIHDLELNNGALSSKGKNVKLGNGVRMIVHVDILG
jgi:hypothetical protein